MLPSIPTETHTKLSSRQHTNHEASDMAKGATRTVGSLSVANTNCPVALSLSNMPPCLGKIYPPVLSKFDYWHPRPYSHANVNQRWKLDLRA